MIGKVKMFCQKFANNVVAMANSTNRLGSIFRDFETFIRESKPRINE